MDSRSAIAAAMVAPAGHQSTRRRERAHRVALLHSLLHSYQLQIHDWSGTSYVVTNAHGKSAPV
jgi:hypothetical protein